MRERISRHWVTTWHFFVHSFYKIQFLLLIWNFKNYVCAFYLYHFLFNHPYVRKCIKLYFMCVCVTIWAEGFFSEVHESCVAIKSCTVGCYCDFVRGWFFSSQLYGFYCECYREGIKNVLSRRQSCASVHILFRNVKDKSFCSKSEKRNIYIFQKIRQKVWLMEVKSVHKYTMKK